MKRLLFDIVLNDKFSRNMKKIAGGADSSINKLNKSLAKTKPLSRNIDHLENKLRDLRDAQKKAFSVKDIRRYSSEIKKTSRELAKLEKKGRVKGGSSGGGTAGGMLGKAGLVGMGLGAVYGGIRLGKEIVDTTAKYQRFEAVLKNSYGSGMKAKQVMSELTNFASKTPFQIDELTDSFVKLKNAGLEPSMKEMTNLGDLAASQGKSFGQLSEALLDAQMGEFERLKEFGIKGSTKGNKYQFIFKGQKTLVDKNAKAVKNYMLSLGKLKGVQGGMNAISKTTGGQLSNLADNWDQLKAVMGDANRGVIKDAIGGFSSLVAGVKNYMTVPLSKKMREEQHEIRTLVGAITDYNTSSEDRMGLLNQLKEQYPDFLGNIDAETVSNEELLKRLDAVNASYERRIALQQNIEDKEDESKKLAEIQMLKAEAQKQLSRYNLAIST
ncbi:MAG: tape measure protein, partial [Bacteroidales bacterium]|nr:tape measure protein [Bacteroidales bacterium]